MAGGQHRAITPLLSNRRQRQLPCDCRHQQNQAAAWCEPRSANGDRLADVDLERRINQNDGKSDVADQSEHEPRGPGSRVPLVNRPAGADCEMLDPPGIGTILLDADDLPGHSKTRRAPDRPRFARMDQYDIRELTPDGLDDGFALSSAAGWNQRIDDWRMLLALAPRGCFAAWSRDQVVGTAIGIDYGGFGWIAMMLVHPAHRSRGLGRRLLEAAVDAVPADRLMRLDATPLGRPLYQSYGFVDEARLTRFVAPAVADRLAASAEPGEISVGVRPLGRADLARMVDVDARVFGGNRQAVLEWALAAAPDLSWILERTRDTPEYCFGRRGRLYTQIGPVVANDDPGARALVTAALCAAPQQPIIVDAADDYATFCGWLRTCGFEGARPLFRMQRPPADGSGARFTRRTSPAAERAILGPEFA